MDQPTFICRESLLVYDSDTAFAMLMAYRAIFSTFALILGIIHVFQSVSPKRMFCVGHRTQTL